MPAASRSQALLAWLPPLLWATVILSASGDRLSTLHTYGLLARWLIALGFHTSPLVMERLNVVGRKTAHLLEYALLFALWFRAWSMTSARRGVYRYAVPLALVLAVATTDELLQSRTHLRGASAFDVVLDVSGGLAAATVLLALRQRRNREDLLATPP